MSAVWDFADFDDHEHVHMFRDRASGLTAVIAVHSTHLGPGAGGVSDPLRRDGRSTNLTSTASVNGMLGDWRWSVSGNYADADQRTFTDRFNGLTASVDRFDSSQQTFGIAVLRRKGDACPELNPFHGRKLLFL